MIIEYRLSIFQIENMASPIEPLSNRQKSLCEYGGFFGALMSLVCLIQHFLFAIPGWLTYPMIPVYILSIIAFILLAVQKPVSLILLIIAAVGLTIIEYVLTKHFAFSLIILLLFIYTVVIIITLFTEQIPQRLREKQKNKKKEEDFWKDKL